MTTETDPFDLFAAWMAEAAAREPNDPNAMTLATVGPQGRPSARIVLLKGADREGLVFYTNTQSRKGAELAENAAIGGVGVRPVQAVGGARGAGGPGDRDGGAVSGGGAAAAALERVSGAAGGFRVLAGYAVPAA